MKLANPGRPVADERDLELLVTADHHWLAVLVLIDAVLADVLAVNREDHVVSPQPGVLGGGIRLNIVDLQIALVDGKAGERLVAESSHVFGRGARQRKRDGGAVAAGDVAVA